MRTATASQLVNALVNEAGISNAQDFAWEWLSGALTKIMSRRWVWAVRERGLLTIAPITETLSCTWTAGDSYVLFAAAPDLTYLHTGRVVRIGEEGYTLTDVAKLDALRYYVDRPIAVSGSGILTSYRTDFGVKTSAIKSVTLDRSKLEPLDPDAAAGSYYWQSHPETDRSSSRPARYTAHSDVQIPPPLYPPDVTDSGGGAGTIGQVRYAYARRDPESGVESRLGPYSDFTNTTGNAPQIVYGNPSGDITDRTSYQLVLYRSKVTESVQRGVLPTAAMWAVQVRDPGLAGLAFVDTINNRNLIVENTNSGRGRLWQGQWTRVVLVSPPDRVYSLRVRYQDDWGHGLDAADQIPLGRDDVVRDLLRLYFSANASMTTRDPEAHWKSLIYFNKQLEFYCVQQDEADRADRNRGQERLSSEEKAAIPGDGGFSYKDSVDWRSGW